MTEQQHSPVLGVDFGGTSIKAGICRGPKIEHVFGPLETAQFEGSGPALEALAKLALEAKTSHPGLAAIGIGVPGLVNFNEGLIYDLTNVSGWKNVRAKDILQERTGLPVFLDNDANAMAYAEWKYGAGQPYQTVVALTLGTGVGGGLVINDRMHRGASFCAGEIGQMSVDYQGREGHYGNYGALERYIGNVQIAEHAAELFKQAGRPRDPASCTPRDLAILAGHGDPVAARVWVEFSNWLGTVLADVVWLLNPEAIVIGGGISNAGNLIFDPLNQRLKQMLSDVLFENTRVLHAHFGSEAGMIGNAAMAMDILQA